MKKFVLLALASQLIFVFVAFESIVIARNNLDIEVIYRNVIGFGSSWYNEHLFKLNIISIFISLIPFVISIAKVKESKIFGEYYEFMFILPVMLWFFSLVIGFKLGDNIDSYFWPFSFFTFVVMFVCSNILAFIFALAINFFSKKIAVS